MEFTKHLRISYKQVSKSDTIGIHKRTIISRELVMLLLAKKILKFKAYMKTMILFEIRT